MKNGGFKVISLDKSFYMKPDEYLNGWAKKCGWKATLVYDSLWRHADRSREAFPSRKLMAEEHGVSEGTIKKGINTLVGFNIIKREQKQSRTGKFLHNTYLLLAKEHWKEPVVSHRPTVNRGISQTPTVVSHRPTKDTHIKYTHILSIAKPKNLYAFPETEFQKIADTYQVPLSFVKSKYDDLINYCERTGRRYKNYLAALRNFVKVDALKIRKEAGYSERKRGIDATEILRAMDSKS